MTKHFFLLFLAIFSLAACNSVSESDQSIREKARQNLSEGKSTPPVTMTAESKNPRVNKFNENDAAVSSATTTIQFKEQLFDFGTIKEGDLAKHTYTFTNTGTEPLIISKAKGSCGCTVPSYSEEPVAPGETGKIDVVFDSKGKPGNNTKTVTLTANTEPVKTILTIKGKVTPKKKK